ncbi:MAG: hypothetical protein R6V12_14275 [Candidatus Hydrogenedentota bacterium]
MRKWYLFGLIVLLVGLIAPAGFAGEEAPAEEAPPPPPPDEAAPKQVNVSVKVVEFQTVKSVETGFSAFFARRNKERLYGRVTSGNGAIRTADLTFPTSSGSRLEGLTVFLDNISTHYGDIEMVLQALVDENRAYILSRPKAMVMIGAERPGTVIKTVREIPYEDTTVVGATVVQATSFRDTGVALTLKVPKVTDDDGDWATLEDTYINLNVQAEVKELGSRIVIALDDSLTSGGTQITAPVFITRSIQTNVWVRHGQVLVLGGLYRNTKQKSLETVPWLTQAEDVAVGLAERVVPGNFIGAPLSATVGHRNTDDGRRELVFFIKSEVWRPSYLVADEHGFVDLEEETSQKVSPTGLLTDILEGVSDIPQNLGEAITGEPTDEGIEAELKREDED